MLVVIVLSAAALYAGRGAFAAVATFLMAFIAWLLTVNYYTLVQKLILMVSDSMFPYSDAIALLSTFLVAFLLLQYFAISYLEEHIQLNAVINGFGGAAFGAMTGFVLAGVLAIAWFMMPASAHYRDPDTKEPPVALGVDEKVLTIARFMANDRIAGTVAFDPSHTFMRTHTLKYATLPSASKDTPWSETLEKRRKDREAAQTRRDMMERESVDETE